jgi:hypothetical protein
MPPGDKTLIISKEEKLSRLKLFASDMEIDIQSAHSEACRLAEVAVEARKYAAASEADANEAFDKMGRLSDKGEEIAEKIAALEENIS